MNTSKKQHGVWDVRSHTRERSTSVTHSPWHSWKRENIFCLWFTVFPSGTLLVDSLNCPSRAKHTPVKQSIHAALCSPFLSLQECTFGWCVSLLLRKMMSSIILRSPGRYKLLFPWRIPVLYTLIDQGFTVSCKRASVCGSCCPSAETKQRRSFTGEPRPGRGEEARSIQSAVTEAATEINKQQLHQDALCWHESDLSVLWLIICLIGFRLRDYELHHGGWCWREILLNVVVTVQDNNIAFH